MFYALLRRYDGVNAAILINERDHSLGVNNLAGEFLDHHLHQLIEGVSAWPRGNLFPKLTRIPDRKPYPSGRDRSPGDRLTRIGG